MAHDRHVPRLEDDRTELGALGKKVSAIGLVIGVARRGTPEMLFAGGADVVVGDLGEIQLVREQEHRKGEGDNDEAHR